jgi:hypothetical protein
MTYEVTRNSKDVSERLNKKCDMTADQIGLLGFFQRDCFPENAPGRYKHK